MTYSNADGVEIGPKLVVEAGSHVYFIEFPERANRAAATESDDQVVELSNPREKILWAKENSPRGRRNAQPVFLGLRSDKKATDVIREMPV